MAPVIVFPDPVTLGLPYLRTALDDATVTVSGQVPSPRPARLVRLRRAGGLERINGTRDLPRLDAQVWCPDEDDALALAALVRGHLLAAPGLVAGVERARTFAGPFTVPDPDDETPRVLLTVEWQVRGTQAPAS